MIPLAEIRKLQKDTELHYLGGRERHAETACLSSVNKITSKIAEGIQLSYFSCFCDYLYCFFSPEKKEKFLEMHSSQSSQFGIILALIIFQEEQQIYNCQSTAVC